MAQTQYATGNALTVKLWSEKLFRDQVKDSFFAPFMGQGGSGIVDVKTELEKGKGDKITVPLRMRLQSPGVNSGTQLRGNEEALVTYDNSVTLEEYAHAVLTRGPLDEQRVKFSIPEESRMALKDWGSEKIDQLCFDSLFTTGSDWFYRNGGATGAFARTTVEATAKAGCNASYPITPSFIQGIRAWAKTGGSNRYRIPLRPVKVKGKDYFVLLVHPNALYSLKQDTTFWFPAAKDALERGKDNPIFTGATAIWDGVVIYEHENVPTYTNGGGASVPCSKFALLGAQALLWAWGRRPIMVEEEIDYKRQKGYSWQMIAGVAKSVFNSLDFGSLVGYVAQTNVATI